MNIEVLDNRIINFFMRVRLPLARVSMFVIYFWFGILKILDVSPANPLVMQLQQKTLPFFSFGQFIVLFGLFEMLIGVLFLFPKFTRLVIVLFAFHMVTTLMPLLFLPSVTWQSAFTPTLEGQYIIKNLALISVVVFLGSQLKPMQDKFVI